MEKKLTIPQKTASPTAAFFRDESPAEAALLEIQTDNARYLWQALVRRMDFEAAQYTLWDGRERILSHSSREGIDWQLSYIGSDGIPMSHGSFIEDSHYDPMEGRSMKEMFHELSTDSSREAKEVTFLLGDTGEGEKNVDKKTYAFITDMAKLYAVNNRIPIDPESEFFRAFERDNGAVDRTEYQHILTDTLLRGDTLPRLAILQSRDYNITFRSWDDIDREKVKSGNYEIIHLSDEMGKSTADEVYDAFNVSTQRPGDYYGTSVSMGNVIVFENNGTFTAQFVDTFGFVDLPENFLSQETRQKILYGLDVRQERDLLQRILEFVSAQDVEVDMTQERERMGEISREYETIFALADLSKVNEENQNILKTIYGYQQESGRNYGIMLDGGTYYAVNLTGEKRRLAADHAEEYRREINDRFSRAAQEISREKENSYHMEATPGYREEEGQFPFFIQRYHLAEHGQRTPEKVVYMGDAQTASTLSCHMNAGTDYGEAVIENIQLRRTLNLPIKTGETWLLSSEVEKENESLAEQVKERTEKIHTAMQAAGYVYDSINSAGEPNGTQYFYFDGELGANGFSVQFMNETEALEWLENVVLEPEAAERVEQVLHPERYETVQEVPHGEDGVITLHLRYREPITINGWTAETDKITFDSREELTKYIGGESAYDALDNSVSRKDNEILLFAENKNGEIVWQPQEREIFSFTAYDGNEYQIIDSWQEAYSGGEESLSCKIGYAKSDGEDYYLAVIEKAESYNREYEFDVPPTRKQVIDLFIDDEAYRDIDRREEQVSPAFLADVEDTEKKQEIQPIREYFGDDGKILVGSDIGIDTATGHVNREPVYRAVSDFEQLNYVPTEKRVIREDGDYTDRQTLYDGYDIYVGMSHLNDPELSRYRETIGMIAENGGNSRERQEQKCTAETYYALKNGLTAEQVMFMLETSAEERFPDETMRNIRHAFESGMTKEQIEITAGQDFHTQQTMLEYLYESGDLERAGAMRGADMATAYYIYRGYKDNSLSAEKAACLVKAANALSEAEKGKNRYDEMSQEAHISILAQYAGDNTLTAEGIERLTGDFIAQDRTQNLEEFIQQQGGIAAYYPHGEDERSRQGMPSEQEKTTATEGVELPEEKKSAKDLLSEQLTQGVKDMMESENYKNWLATSSSYFTNNYSLGNAILIYRQKPDATYVKGYEAWKEFGRNVGQGAKGAQIFVPVMAYDKTEGALYRMIMSNLREQVKQNTGQIAAFRVGLSGIEFTMNAREQVGLRVNGKERAIFQNYQEVKRYISSAILNKVPMYFTVGRVFDVKDTIVPEYLWVKNGYSKDEIVKDKDGNPIKNRRGEVKIINTPERQGKFKPSLEFSISEPKDPEKMAVLYDVLKTVSARNGVPVMDVARDSDEILRDGADGYFSRRFTEDNPKGFIKMPDDLEPTEKCAVLMHEMGHSDLHGDLAKLAAQMGEKSIPRHMREIQAESVAFATARQFGIETDTGSFQYLAEYSKGFELQDLKKSLDVIYGECRKLTQEISAELDARGLNLDLTERVNEPMEAGTVRTLSKQYTAYALEQSEAISVKMKELPSLAADNRKNPELLDVVKEQQKCMDRQMGAVNAIYADVKALQGATTRDGQTAALERLEASRRCVKEEIAAFAGLVDSFAEISSQSKATLKEEFYRDPLATLESMKKNHPKLENLSSLQLAYIGKSEYVKKEWGNLLKNKPEEFVERASRRAEALEKAVSKNGVFVEVNLCEQWTDKPIVQSGTFMHPKIADTIIKQAEMQIRGLKAEAEKEGDYFPYNKCDLTVFYKSSNDLSAYHTRVDIGDGAQTSLSDHLTQLCGKESELVSAFEKATRERGAKEKIMFNDIPVVTETEIGGTERMPEASTVEGWVNAIEQEKSGAQSRAQEDGTIDRDKSLDSDGKEH